MIFLPYKKYGRKIINMSNIKSGDQFCTVKNLFQSDIIPCHGSKVREIGDEIVLFVTC